MLATTPAEFKKRLKIAVDNLGDAIPAYGEGQQVYFAEKCKVTQEAVRKWFSGEAKPRTDRIEKLAQILNVAPEWLALGIEPEISHAQKVRAARTATGAVHAIYGMLTMAGGQCAFPSENDPRAEYVDFYAIANGTQHAIHVCAAREIGKGQYEFIVPRNFEDVTCLGVVHNGGTWFNILRLPAALIRKHKQGKSSDFAVSCKLAHGEYRTERDTWPAIQNIQDL